MVLLRKFLIPDNVYCTNPRLLSRLSETLGSAFTRFVLTTRQAVLVPGLGSGWLSGDEVEGIPIGIFDRQTTPRSPAHVIDRLLEEHAFGREGLGEGVRILNAEIQLDPPMPVVNHGLLGGPV